MFPNVSKWEKRTNRITEYIIAYVDDLRALDYSTEQAWHIVQRAYSYIQYLGIQDAARKLSLDEGPWSGGGYFTTNLNLTKSVTKEKWEKGRILVNDLVNEQGGDPRKQLSYKKLEIQFDFRFRT